MAHTIIKYGYNLTVMHYSLHEGVTFSIHSLTRTGSSCLLRCHDYITTCAEYIIFSIYSTIAHLYWAPLIFAYGAGPPKVSGPSEGHGGEQHTIA